MTIIELEIFQQEKWIVRGYPEISLQKSAARSTSHLQSSRVSVPQRRPPRNSWWWWYDAWIHRQWELWRIQNLDSINTPSDCGVSIFFWVTFHGDFKIVQAGPHAYFKRVRSQNMGESAREILRRASIGSSILMANATLHLKTAQTNLASPFSSTQFYHLGLFKRVIVCNFWVYHFLTNRKLDFGWFRASTRIFVT